MGRRIFQTRKSRTKHQHLPPFAVSIYCPGCCDRLERREDERTPTSGWPLEFRCRDLLSIFMFIQIFILGMCFDCLRHMVVVESMFLLDACRQMEDWPFVELWSYKTKMVPLYCNICRLFSCQHTNLYFAISIDFNKNNFFF